MYDLTNQDIALRVGLALLLGALLGFERELREKPSGLRTHALVAEGAAIFMLVSLLIGQALTADGPTVYDPSRIASTVVQGVGFLVAGVIIAKGARIQGMTTAADLWVTAAIGLAAGAGFYFLAVFGAVTTIVVLVVLQRLELKLWPRYEPEESVPGVFPRPPDA